MITSSDLVARDGYVEVFYELADLLDIPAQSLSPKQVWEEQMLPRILALEADKAALVEWRRGEVQAIHAAISTRNWHGLEVAANQLRDKMDATLSRSNLDDLSQDIGHRRPANSDLVVSDRSNDASHIVSRLGELIDREDQAWEFKTPEVPNIFCASRTLILTLFADNAALAEGLKQIETMQDGEQAWWARMLATAALGQARGRWMGYADCPDCRAKAKDA